MQRDRGNLDISPEEIDLWLQGDSVEFGENSLKLYEQSYKEPIIVNEEEYANVLAPYAKYMVASAETEPADGWEYTTIVNTLLENPTIEAKDLGKVICDSYYSFFDYDNYYDYQSCWHYYFVSSSKAFCMSSS